MPAAYVMVGAVVIWNLSEPVWIGTHVSSGCTRVLEPNSHAVGFGESSIRLDRLLNQRSNLDANEFEDDASSLHLLDIENVVDESHETLAVGVRDRDQAAR